MFIFVSLVFIFFFYYVVRVHFFFFFFFFNDTATTEIYTLSLHDALPIFLDPGQQEHLVVHGQAEREGKDDDRRPDLDGAEGGEPEQAGQVAVLEHPDQRAEGGAEGQNVHDQRLEWDEHRPGHQEQQRERSNGDPRGRPRCPARDLGLEVGQRRLGAGDPGAEGGPDVAEHADQMLGGGALGGAGRDHVDLADVSVQPAGDVDRGHARLTGERGGIGADARAAGRYAGDDLDRVGLLAWEA